MDPWTTKRVLRYVPRNTANFRLLAWLKHAVRDAAEGGPYVEGQNQLAGRTSINRLLHAEAPKVVGIVSHCHALKYFGKFLASATVMNLIAMQVDLGTYYRNFIVIVEWLIDKKLPFPLYLISLSYQPAHQSLLCRQ